MPKYKWQKHKRFTRTPGDDWVACDGSQLRGQAYSSIIIDEAAYAPDNTIWLQPATAGNDVRITNIGTPTSVGDAVDRGYIRDQARARADAVDALAYGMLSQARWEGTVHDTGGAALTVDMLREARDRLLEGFGRG